MWLDMVLSCLMCGLVFVYWSGDRRELHSFPTRRSSDLVCYAQPSPLFDDGSQLYAGNMDLLDGPGWDSSTIDWDYRGYPSKGFKINGARNSGNYDGKSSVYKNNFPSTGSNGLYFYLLLAGISPEAVITANGSNISAVEGGNVRDRKSVV